MSLTHKQLTVIKEIAVPEYSVALAQANEGHYHILYGLSGAEVSRTNPLLDFNVALKMFDIIHHDLVTASN